MRGFTTTANRHEVRSMADKWAAGIAISTKTIGGPDMAINVTVIVPRDQYSSEIMRQELEVNNYGWNWIDASA